MDVINWSLKVVQGLLNRALDRNHRRIKKSNNWMAYSVEGYVDIFPGVEIFFAMLIIYGKINIFFKFS